MEIDINNWRVEHLLEGASVNPEDNRETAILKLYHQIVRERDDAQKTNLRLEESYKTNVDGHIRRNKELVEVLETRTKSFELQLRELNESRIVLEVGKRKLEAKLASG